MEMIDRRIVPLRFAAEGYGGKAAGLADLISWNIPVPAGFALTPEIVYQIAQDPLGGENQQILSQLINNSHHRYAVRSSALCEDGISDSFAGMFDTVLGVNPNAKDLALAITKVWEGLGSARLNSYISERAVELSSKPQLAVVIQEMIEPLLAGVAFSSALSVKGEKVIFLEAIEGLGDSLVAGKSIPTRIEVPLNLDSSPNIENIKVIGPLQTTAGIDSLLKLIAKASGEANRGLDIEWAIDKDGNPWLLQARPITKDILVPATNMRSAVPASSGLVSAKTFTIEKDDDLRDFPSGAILVAEVTDTNFLPAMRRAAGIITEEGGILSHAAIIAREIGVPCIVGYPQARQRFPSNTLIEMDGASGEVRSDLANKTMKSFQLDWGSAYLFENLIPIRIDGVTVLFDPTATGICLHQPKGLSLTINTKTEIFSRENFGQSPFRYETDKYLWYFEWERFQKSPFFSRNLDDAKNTVETLDERRLSNFYKQIISLSEKLLETGKAYKDPASTFLLDETLLSVHFLLTMLVPEGYALKRMYSFALPKLNEKGLAFVDLMSGSPVVEDLIPDLRSTINFSRRLALLRNSIYKELLDKDIMRDDYFDDRTDRAKKACDFLKVERAEEDIISDFYNNIAHVPFLKVLE